MVRSSLISKKILKIVIILTQDQEFWEAGKILFIFRERGSTGNYFRGAGEQVRSLVDLGSPAKK